MTLPDILLCRIRGAALAVAVVGCTASEAAAPLVVEAEPTDHAPAPAAPADPVTYELTSETARLDAVDATAAIALARRARRVENGDPEGRHAGTRVLTHRAALEALLSVCGRG